METVRLGSRGEAVKKLQTLLSSRGYPVTVDGAFGPNTNAAVRQFQKAAGLKVDGIVGAKTWAALQTAKEPGTEHFKLREFRCKDGSAVPQAYWGNVGALMTELEKIRKIWGKPITIYSGYRTKTYNAYCGGAKASQHLKANAVDIAVSGVSPAEVYAKLDKLYPNQGLGRYATFTHFDLRGYASRWKGSGV